MEILYPRCCGLDVHQKSVTACLLVSETETETEAAPARPHKEVRTCSTMTAGLLAWSGWLASHAVTQVAMESTGVYWKPVWNVLEGSVELLLVNAHHVKQVPGRKTDVRDAEWLADLLRHGLLRPSFVPPLPQRELRELTRLRTARVRARAAELNRLHKTLAAANVKLGAVAIDLQGISGRAILAALVAGQTEPTVLAELARGKLRAKLPALEQALTGRFGPHQRFLVAEHLATIDELEAGVARLSAEIAPRLAPPAAPTGNAPGRDDLEADPVARLDSIPGVGRTVAEAILAEVGTDVRRFPTAGHLASWAGLCPGQDESAGKRRSGKTRKGSPWLRTLLVEAAQAAAKTKDTYLRARYQRLAARRGAKRAILALAHTILVIAYHILKEGTTYRELGGNFYDERDRTALQRRLVPRLERLGHHVTLTPAAA